MRFNKDTERSILLDDIASQCKAAIKPREADETRQVWDTRNGGWINPADNQGETVSELTLQLWSVRHKLQQLSDQSLPSATVQSLKRDVLDIVQELQRF